MTSRAFIVSTFVEKLIAYGTSRGLSSEEMLKAANLPLDSVFHAERRVPITCTMALWEMLVRELDDPGVPIKVARTCNFGDYHAYGFALMTSRTMHDVLRRTVRYSKVFTNSGVWHIEMRGEQASATWRRELPLVLGHRVANENALAEFAHSFRELTRAEFRPTRVCFRHPAPPSILEHQLFFDAPLVFEAASDTVFFPRRLLDVSLMYNSHALEKFFEQYLEQQLDQASPDMGLTARVREAVLHELSSGPPSADQIAAQLSMSKRSMRRLLAAEGTSYRSIVSSLRQEYAEKLLLQPEMSVSEIAFMLGYTDAGAFSRAFRRGVGVSPREYRTSQSTLH